jgi:hypothetical protein
MANLMFQSRRFIRESNVEFLAGSLLVITYNILSIILCCEELYVICKLESTETLGCSGVVHRSW